MKTLTEFKSEAKDFYTANADAYLPKNYTPELFNEKVNNRAKYLFKCQKERIEKHKLLIEFCAKHDLQTNNYSSIFGANGLFFERSQQKDVENELNVNLNDFFDASGKTYFFAKTKIGLLEFYHNHRQSYSFSIVSNERLNEFKNKREKWVNAPFAEQLGQNDNSNLFVC